jgi:hypothetical protein
VDACDLSAVYLAPVTDPHHRDDQLFVDDLEENAIVALWTMRWRSFVGRPASSLAADRVTKML